jgi:uncharacterized protein (TIGR03435 family)
MTRLRSLFLAALCFPAGLISQQTADKPTFDIADVHPSPRADWVRNSTHLMMGGYLSGDRYELRRATLVDMIKIAWDIDANKIYSGPSWIDYDRYEVVAKTKPGTSPETLRLMLQALLADRFGLVVRPDTQLVPGYTLSRADRELKLKPGTEIGNPGCRAGIRMSMGPNAGPAIGSIPCQNVSMTTFAATLARALSSPVVTFQVIDKTGLEGTWDIDLQYTQQPGGIAATDAAIAEEVGKLGLSLELGKIPQPVLTVQKANEQPTPNSPEVEKTLPPRGVPEFEAASVRLANNESGGSRSLIFEPGGRVSAHGMAPSILIQQAFNQNSYEQIVGLPKSFSGSVAKNITIVAKAPDNWFPENAANANNQARDILYAMLRTLLIDRYQMKFHYEDRPVDALTLTANKPKLMKADPAGRTGCKRVDQQQQGRALIVKLACTNITMAQFAEQMQGLDTGMIYPVHDETGIDGAWDFTLTYDALSRLANFRVGPPSPAASDSPTPQAEDPSGSVSFLDAVQKQLGLKVETHKRQEPVLVIDQMREDPIDN